MTAIGLLIYMTATNDCLLLLDHFVCDSHTVCMDCIVYLYIHKPVVLYKYMQSGLVAT